MRKSKVFSKPKNMSRSVVAAAAALALLPAAGWALDLADAPPGTVMPYVAPNIILSLDDSGSMGTKDGNADKDTRMKVLKDSLTSVFSDTALLPKNKIRLAWQIMHNNGNYTGAQDVNSGGANSMWILDDTHRANFLNFVSGMKANGITPSHKMFRQAYNYMSQAAGPNNPWRSMPYEPGEAPAYLACRRSYHIMMTDGRWNYVNGMSPTKTNMGTSNPGPDTHIGNYDGQNHVLPDLVQYDTKSDQTRIYRDNAGINSADNNPTLADWALKSWAENLQPHMWSVNNQPYGTLLPSPSYTGADPDEVIGGKTIQKYWNPRYNPATWPHMVTYSIGFSKAATTWPGNGNIVAPTEKVPFSEGGSYANLISGTLTWPAMSAENVRALDLWHAAINGRGRFYAVEDGADLEKAFRDILEAINAENEVDTSATSVAASGGNASRNDVGLFATSYDPAKDWKGEVKGQELTANGNLSDLWGGSSTADFLDALSDNDVAGPNSQRSVLSYNDATNQGVGFRYALLSNDQQNSLDLDGLGHPDGQGAQRVNYIRGDKSLEGSTFRARESRQGDIVNSEIWYEPGPVSNFPIDGYADFAKNMRNRTPMLYVGGNDGMLHGFSAEDGREKLAYVPKGVIPDLRHLTETNYVHRYYVDGSPLVGDFATTTTPSAANHWKTALVGTLGGGGKGYFVLDVTDPDSGFGEGLASGLVLMDKSLHVSEPDVASCPTTGAVSAECDFGHIFGGPVKEDGNSMVTTQIARMNNDRWAVILGNGYNSRSQRPVLFVQYLDGAQELIRIQATTDAVGSGDANDNGLSAPRVVDINGDNRADIVYAGDLLGNVWKFDLTSPNDSEWEAAFSGQPFYTAVGPASPGGTNRNLPQPITAAPTVKENNRGAGGMMVAFGTGKNIERDDPINKQVQSLYGVLDNTHYEYRDPTDPSKGVKASSACSPNPCPPTPVGTGVNNLVEQAIDAQHTGADGREYWTLEDPDDTGSSKIDWASGDRGWYMDLPEDNERLLKNISFYAGTNILSVYSQIPSRGTSGDESELGESCSATDVVTGRQFLTLLNIMDGRRPAIPLLDLDGDGLYDGADENVSRVEVNIGAQTQTVVTPPDKYGDDSERILMDGDILGRLPPELALRPSWRQLQ